LIAQTSAACPTDETLALLAAGDLDAETRMEVLAHVERCPECMAAVLAANEHLAEEAATQPSWSSSSRWWMAIAAAVLIAAIAIPMLRQRSDPMRQLVAAVPLSQRTVEPRLSGGFAWAPYRGPARAIGTNPDAAEMKLNGAAGNVIDHARHDSSESAQHAAGVALVLVQQPSQAVERLRHAPPDDARAASDLAAACYAAAAQTNNASLLNEGLAAADRALRLDPKQPEALFNRALILERLGRPTDARTAWLRYLAADAHSPWAAEAREHLSVLSFAPRSGGNSAANAIR